MADKDFKVKNKLFINGLTHNSGVLLAENKGVDSHTNLATQYGGTGTTTSPTSGQVLYSVSGSTYAPTTLADLVTGSKYQADAPTSPSVGQIWIESDSTSDSFDPNLIRRQAFTATAGQTIFTTSISFIEGYEQVYFNGLLLLRTTDYTTSGGNTVTLTSAAAVNDIIEVVTVTNLNSTNTYTQAEIDSALSAKLSTSTAASTYLTQSNAASTYLTQSNASSTYLTSSTAASTYLTSSNASSTYLTQSNAASTYLPQNSYNVAGKNAIINGGFDIWQRGNTFSNPGNLSYTADRWFSIWGSTNRTVSRQAGFSGNNYCIRVGRNSGISDTLYTGIATIIESANMYLLQGKTVTLSFYARAGSNFSGNVLATVVQSATGIDQGSGNWWAGNWTAITTNAGYYINPTTTATRYSTTFTVPSDATELIIYHQYQGSGTAGAADYFETTGFQLEVGSFATQFSRAGGDIAGELAKCQRYYYRETKPATGSPLIGAAYARTTGISFATWTFPVTMRSTPTLSFSNATQDFNLQIAAGDFTFNTLSGSSLASTTRASLRADAGSYTIGQAGVLSFNGANAWIEASAEL